MIMFTMMLPFVLIPLVGLAIDATMLYTVQVKLQTAVDGGALAAAQSLSAGLVLSQQTSAATLATDQFIRANLPTGATPGHGYWGAYNFNDSNCNGSTTTTAGTPTGSGIAGGITYSTPGNCVVIHQDDTNKLRTVSVSAGVQVPLLFMRLLGFSSGTVASTGTASRRDVVLVLVIDRSSSMSNVINGVSVMTTLQEAATTNFVDKFQSGRDKLGLVVLGGSSLVAYPAADWHNTVRIGPQTTFATDSPNMDTLINSIVVASNTGTADALANAYKEILATDEPGALNVIVLFTDGQPNGITAVFNDNTGVGNGTGGSIVNNTYCKNYSVAPNGGLPTTLGTSMLGWIAQWGNYAAGNNGGNGIFNLAEYDSTTNASVTLWLQNGTEPTIAGTTSAAQAGYKCDYESGSGNVSKDLTQLPAMDYYGNSTTGTNYVIPGAGSGTYTTSDYKQSSIWNGNTWLQMCNNGNRPAAQSLTANLGDSCQIGLASWNAADMEAMRIHMDVNGLKPIIYALGFEGDNGDDPAFMQRLANCKPGVACSPGGALSTNTVYWSGQPSGMYVPIAVPTDIAPALQTVLAEILRLSM